MSASTFRPRVEQLDGRCLPSFLTPAVYPGGSYPIGVVSGDFNGDTVPDLAVANYLDSTVSVLRGDGLGGFGAKTDFATGVMQRSLVVGDVSGDWKLDLITVNDADVSVLRGDGAGNFAPPASIVLPGLFPSGYGGAEPLAQRPRAAATGDFNGDGRLDLAVTGFTEFQQSYTGPDGGTYYRWVNNTYVNVLPGNGSGGFNPAVTTPLSGLNPNSLVAGRFNADTKDDLAIVDNLYSGTVSVLLSNGSGGFSSSITPGDGYYHYSVLTGDVNGDGIGDLVTANAYSASVLLGNGTAGVGDGTFQPPRTTDFDFQLASLAVGDFNADGKLDLVATSSFFTETGDEWSGYSGFYTGQVGVLLGHGGGTFGPPSTSALEGGYPTGVASGDFNADGFADVAVTDSNNNFVSVLVNDQSWPPPPPPTVSVGDATVTEGNAGTVNATFTVRLSYASAADVTVHYATENGTATAGSDYAATSGDVTIPAGQTSRTFAIAVIGDRVAEATETFAVNLSAPVNATIGDGQGTGTILDNEPRISINDVTVTEGNTGTVNATFTVSLSVAYDVAVTVHYQTANGTATAGSDYAAASGDVIIAAGQTTKTFTVAVLGDRSAEPTENFVVNLSAATNGLIVDSQGVGTILDNEPRISISDVTRAEGKKGQTTLFIFTVTLSAAYDQAVTMSFRTLDGTAKTSDSDYIAKTGTLTFAPGETTKTITIEVKGDIKKEANETFYLDLFGNSSNALFTRNRGLGTILNDD